MSMEEKLEIIKEIGLQYIHIIKFTDEFSNISAEEFLDEMIIPFFNPKYFIVGYDHHFGKDREGGPEFLTKFCLDNSIAFSRLKGIFTIDLIDFCKLFSSLILPITFS